MRLTLKKKLKFLFSQRLRNWTVSPRGARGVCRAPDRSREPGPQIQYEIVQRGLEVGRAGHKPPRWTYKMKDIMGGGHSALSQGDHIPARHTPVKNWNADAPPEAFLRPPLVPTPRPSKTWDVLEQSSVRAAFQAWQWPWSSTSPIMQHAMRHITRVPEG